jgi:hypothetical protein
MSTRLKQDAVAGEPQAFDAPRSYPFVSAPERRAAAVAVGARKGGPPNLCVTSPSPEAADTAASASEVVLP